MTVTESEDTKQDTSSGLNYVPVEAPRDAEERASSEESQGRNNHVQLSNATEENALLVRDLDDTSNPKPIRTSNGFREELAPLSSKVETFKDSEIGNSCAKNSFTPPDGGTRAWLIMCASFLINGILFGVINSYSLVFIELEKKMVANGVSDANSKASLVGSLTIGTTFFLSPIAGVLTDKIGIQLTTFIGGAIAATGMLLSSVLSDNVGALYFTYGVMYGSGASLAYTPSLAILGHYFKRYLGLVNGVVTAGSSVFTILVPYIIEAMLVKFGLVGVLRCLAGLTALVMVCAFPFRPILPPTPTTADRGHSRSNLKLKLKEVVNISIWKNKRYVVWAVIIPIALFGYFVPYVHIGKFVTLQFHNGKEKLPIICIAITSGLGRLIFGFIADLPCVNRVLLQQISFFNIGVLTMLLPITSSFEVFICIVLGMGLFDGCFISLLGPIAFDFCGQKGATQAIGCLLGMCSIPLILGPYIAGRLFDHTNSYELAFYLAGIPPIVGALTMFAVRLVRDDATRDETSPQHQSLTRAAWQNEEKELQDMSRNGERNGSAKSP